MANIVVLLTSDDMRDVDSIPMYSDDITSFYWAADAESPVPHQRVWCLLDKPGTPEEAHKLASERLGMGDDINLEDSEIF